MSIQLNILHFKLVFSCEIYSKGLTPQNSAQALTEATAELPMELEGSQMKNTQTKLLPDSGV